MKISFCHGRTVRSRFLVLSLVFFFFSFSALSGEEIFPDYPPPAEREIQYRCPTARFIDFYGWDEISAGLKGLGVSMVYRNLFDRIWHREEPGFVGYHGSTQEYRIYQDVIRMILEEHLGIPIRKDFHFFRIPGDPQFYHLSLQEYGSYISNYSPVHFLCLNYALYGNFYNWFSCSYYYFADNASANLVNYEEKLVWLFNKIGVDPSAICKAFLIGKSHMGSEKGILIQVFDMSHFNPWRNYYEFSDSLCGSFTQEAISEVVKGNSLTYFPSQIRMLMSNRHTLNPSSPLIIKRYDACPPEKIQAYEDELRHYIRSLDADRGKVEAYKQELFTVWEVEDDQAV